MIERYAQITERFPVWLIEDGLTARLGERIQLVGDDIFVTNPAIITDAISRGVANAALIKVSQIGTVTETLQAMAICRQAGHGQFVSHRSGETTGTFIADLAVSAGCGEFKTGAPARGERVAKYNRLLEIAAAYPDMPYGLASGVRHYISAEFAGVLKGLKIRQSVGRTGICYDNALAESFNGVL
jgi:enolase